MTLRESDDGRSWAIFAGDAYRYALGRNWSTVFDEEPRTLLAVGLNPSVAGVKDDPTIRKEIGFAKRLGCTRLLKVNLFGYIETKSKKLGDVASPIGAENDAIIFAEVFKLDKTRTIVLAAWGSHPMATQERIDQVVAMLPRPIFCLGTTLDGSPRHPARIAFATPLSIWKA